MEYHQYPHESIGSERRESPSLLKVNLTQQNEETRGSSTCPVFENKLPQSAEYTLAPNPPSILVSPQSDPPKGTSNTAPLSWVARILDTWFYEMLATVFSVGCFVAILGILAAYDGKATPKFAYSLTLNTVISILATASKVSLVFVVGECTGQLKWLWFYHDSKRRRLDGMQLFDSASRGPLGALMVLFSHKGRSIVSLGALVMLLSIPYDAFVQQILTYPIRNTVTATSSSNAPTQRATSLLLPLLQDDEEDIVQMGQWSDTFLVNPTCPSGNCTWPLYTSVEMCSECRDITNETAVSCPALPVTSNMTYDGKTVSCHVETPRGYGPTELTLFPPDDDGFRVSIPEQIAWSQMLSSWATGERPYPAVAMAHAEIDIADEAKYRDGYADDLDVGGILEVTKATECTLNLCSRRYNMTVSNGVVSLQKSAPNYGRQFWIDKRNGTAISGKHPEWDLSSLFVRTNFSTCWSPATGNNDTNDDDVSAINLSRLTNTTWADASQLAFCPVAEFVGAQYMEGEKRREWTSGTGVVSEDRLVDASIKRIRTIGLENVIRNIAASYTKQALMASNSTVQGTIFNPEVYVSVDWLWILLPAAVTALGVVFLAATMFVNWRGGLRLWKTSILAVLYHGLTRFGGDEQEGYVRGARNATVSQMETSAQGVSVRLTAVDEKRGLMLD
ncbi:hypothetical protein BJX64DRAFT_84744 [Aspergillus heterothallicus]